MKLLIAVLALAASVSAAEFQNGQAARAVIGQPFFSSHEPGIAAHSLTIFKSRLYAADSASHVQAFDLTKIPSANEPAAESSAPMCALCGFAPIAVANQSVISGVAASVSFGRTVIVADSANHRVSIWRGANASAKPDVVLTRMFLNPVSVAFDGKRLFVGDADWHRVLIWNSMPAVDEAPADQVLGQPDFASAAVSEIPNAASLRNPAALASDGTNLFVADSQDRRILVFTPGDTLLANDAVINSASLLSTPFAPGTLVTLDARTVMSDQSDAESLQVLLDGKPLRILSVSDQELQVQLPGDLGVASAGSLYIRTGHGVTNAIPLKFTSASPGIFAFGAAEPRSALLVHADAQAPVTPQTPAKPGEVVTVWAAGLGQVDAANGTPLKPVTVLVNNEPAEVLSAGLPAGSVGVYEIRVALPASLVGANAAQLFITQSGNISNTVTFPLDSREQ